MRVRDHIALSTAGAALLQPWLGRSAWGLWVGGVLVDVDHYAWFCLRKRQWDPAAAVRFFNQSHPPQRPATRVLHSPLAPLTVLLLGVRRRWLLPLGLGMCLHVALDACHEVRMDEARAAALARDDFTCKACGARTQHVGTHLRRQPWLLPSYEAQNLVSLCGLCHEAEHSSPARSGSWR
jgi:hypothetical protein